MGTFATKPSQKIRIYEDLKYRDELLVKGPKVYNETTVSTCVWCSPSKGNSSRVSGYRTPPVMAFLLVISGVSNGQDPMTKRSYNMRAQSSQIRRERSLRYPHCRSLFDPFLLPSPVDIPVALVASSLVSVP